MKENTPTRQTLLRRASDMENHQAWEEFVSYYKKFIFILLWHMKIPQQECDDIVQQVLVRVWKNLAKFDKERAKFRTWLVTIIRNTVNTHMARISKQNTRMPLSAAPGEEFLNSDEGSIDEFEEIYRKEWQTYITNIALENIKPLFSGKAVEAFTMSLTSASAEQIAEKLDIKVQSVYNLKNRVKGRLIKEIQHLRSELEL